MLTLNGQKSALWHAWKRKDSSYYQHAVECRAVGQHWISIKTLITARRKAGENITAKKWADDNAPCSKRWLDMYAEFAGKWDAFDAAWKWAKTQHYAPERRPGLHSFLDLMRTKECFDHSSKARQEHFTAKTRRPFESGRSNGNSSSHSDRPASTPAAVETLTPINSLVCGDVVDMLKVHVADGSADVAIADVPYFVSRYAEKSAADFYYDIAGMTPRFDQPWDKFESIEDYEQHAERWLVEIMRCLNDQGSAFIFGSFHNIGLINRICQVRDYHIVQQIIWVQRNSRPNAAIRKLQNSHHMILWIAKKAGEYRFNYRQCKQADHSGDYFSHRGKQMRDVWDIPAAPHENKPYGHPSPKPIAVISRLLDVAGQPRGMCLDLFSGSGTGAIAAARWGMNCLSIEREPRYCDMIRRRVKT